MSACSIHVPNFHKTFKYIEPSKWDRLASGENLYLEPSWPNPNTRAGLGELSGSFKNLDLDIRVFWQSHSECQVIDTPSTIGMHAKLISLQWTVDTDESIPYCNFEFRASHAHIFRERESRPGVPTPPVCILTVSWESCRGNQGCFTVQPSHLPRDTMLSMPMQSCNTCNLAEGPKQSKR